MLDVGGRRVLWMPAHEAVKKNRTESDGGSLESVSTRGGGGERRET